MKRVQEWYDLSNRVVFLTGATGKLGPAYADVLSECGADIVCVDVNQKICDEMAATLKNRHGTNPMGLRVDITDRNDVKTAVKAIKQRYEHIDILINNAAFNQVKHIVEGNVATFEDFPYEVWQSTIDVNLTGMLFCCQEIGKVMLGQSHGVILNISSVYGVVAADQRIYGSSGLNSNVAYATTKSAILNLSRYLASYWQGKNIRVNSLSPGGVYNNQDPEFVKNYKDRTMLKRMADKDDLSAALLYLVSDASRFVTGFNLVVDGGWTAW